MTAIFVLHIFGSTEKYHFIFDISSFSKPCYAQTEVISKAMRTSLKLKKTQFLIHHIFTLLKVISKSFKKIKENPILKISTMVFIDQSDVEI